MNETKSKEYHRKYYLKNKEKWKKYNKEYWKINKKHLLDANKERSRQYRIKNMEKCSVYYKKYNKEKRIRKNMREYQKEYTINRRRSDPIFKIVHNLRCRLNNAIQENGKSTSAMFLLGCEVDYFMYYIQKQFTEGMNWDNHGRGDNGMKEWHIDHIRPCSSFDLSKPEEQRKCFHYSNLQPLWAKDNLRKGSKIQ